MLQQHQDYSTRLSQVATKADSISWYIAVPTPSPHNHDQLTDFLSMHTSGPCRGIFVRTVCLQVLVRHTRQSNRSGGITKINRYLSYQTKRIVSSLSCSSQPIILTLSLNPYKDKPLILHAFAHMRNDQKETTEVALDKSNVLYQVRQLFKQCESIFQYFMPTRTLTSS